MKLTRTGLMATAICAVSFFVGSVVAQDDEGMGPMPPWMKQTKEHAELKKLAGEWDVEFQLWMMPGAPPEKAKGTSKFELVFGGKFVRETVKATMMGKPFEGEGLTGYDTVAKEFITVWFDNQSPVMSMFRGSRKDGVMTSTGKTPNMMDPKGTKKDVKAITKYESADKFIFSMWDVGADGKDTKTMELTYTRKK